MVYQKFGLIIMSWKEWVKKNIMLCRKIIICIVQWKVFLFQLVFRKYLEKLLKGPRQT